MSSQDSKNKNSQEVNEVQDSSSTRTDTASTATAKKKTKEKVVENPACRMNRRSDAPVEMANLLSKLDGEGEPAKKAKGRTKKQEMETILNTTHSIKTFAAIDEEK